MSEIVIPRPRSEFYGYTHSFDRHFEHEGRQVDRLVQIETHGIISPRKARELGLPYSVNCHIRMEGVNDCDDVIFLFPIRDKNAAPYGPGNITLVLSPDLPILTPDEMRSKYNNCWVQLSWMFGGEVYIYEHIPPNLIVDIRGVKND